MKPVAIVGNHPKTFGVPYGNKDIDIWGMNLGAYSRPDFDAIIEIHTMKYMLDTRPPIYFAWLEQQKATVYSREKICERSVPYPFEKAYNLTKRVKLNNGDFKFFGSTVDYCIALAILQKRPVISLHGIEMRNDTEYGIQRNSFCFWTGMAAGNGIKLEIVGSYDIFKKPLYGE